MTAAKSNETSWYNLAQARIEEVTQLKELITKKDEEFQKEHKIRMDWEHQIAGHMQQVQDKQRELQGLLAEKDQLEEAVKPIVELLTPEGTQSQPQSLLERLKQVPEQVADYCRVNLKECTNKLLALFKAHNPKAKMEVKYLPPGVSGEQYEALVAETAAAAADFIDSLEE